ncbi:MAG: hypothetical protein P0119_08290 [Nitrospira sp.]|nr:hypothetical protein [Nitrospira sp.]
MKTKQIVLLTAATFLMAGSIPAMAADVLVYPKQNQSKDQQEQDTFSCYKWAKERTGFDPTKPAAQASAPPPQGGPHRRHQAEKQQEAAQQQASKQYEASVEGYQRAYGVCMEGKGYAVK